MKKITVLYSAQLIKLLENLDLRKGDDFRNLPIHYHAQCLVAYAVDLAATGIQRTLPAPILCPPECLQLFDPVVGHLAVLNESYRQSARIVVHMWTGITDACIGMHIDFISKGKNGKPFTRLEGGVDSQGFRRLKFLNFHTPVKLGS